MQLDKNQRKAVNHVTGPAIVVAGPGSGKTTVITERILNLIHAHNVPPSDILAIAFNKKAVEEMETRVSARSAAPVTIRTLHAFGKDIVMAHYARAGFSQKPQIWASQIEQVIQEERQQLARETAATRVALYKIASKKTGRCYIGQTMNPERRRGEHFSYSSNDRLRQSIRAEGVDNFNFEVLEWVAGRDANRREAGWISFYRARAGVFNRADPLRERYSNQLMLEMFCQHFGIAYTAHLDRELDFEDLRAQFDTIKEVVMRAKRQVETGLFDPTSLNDRVARAFAEKYEKVKTEANAIDFEDMLIYAAHLLEVCPDLRETYVDQYPYVLVDEFQDIAPTDFRLISLLSENLFAVGDDDQAIYGFRGGNSEIMQTFASRRDVKKYEITLNYRSTSTIVEHARALIEKNVPRMEKNLRRIKKNLRAQNPMQFEINVVETTPETLAEILLAELAGRRETGILARTNYEVAELKKILRRARVQSGPPGSVEITTIHKAKGCEYERVLLVQNTLGRHFPHRSDDIQAERRVFYVAMTRAKRELIVIGGKCQFIQDFVNIRKNVGYYLRQFAYWRARRKLNRDQATHSTRKKI